MTITPAASTVLIPGTNVDQPAFLSWMQAVEAEIPDRLLSGLSLYVNGSTGSDSNPGTLASPFASITKALQVALWSTNAGRFSVTINVANGTYAEGLSAATASTNNVIIVGDEVTPANVILAPPASTIGVNVTAASRVQIRGIDVRASGAVALQASATGDLRFQNIRISGTPTTLINSIGNQAVVQATGNFIVDVGGDYLARAQQGGNVNIQARTITFTANVTFATSVVAVSTASRVMARSSVWAVGAFTVTGKRYDVTGNSIIDAGALVIPGTIAGTTATGGEYI